jgi:uncharacterized membrane protein
MLDTAIEQIRAYGTNDAPVSLRLLRLLHDVAVTVENDVMRLRIVERGARVVEGCRGRLPSEDLTRLEQRLAAIEGLLPMARHERRANQPNRSARPRTAP